MSNKITVAEAIAQGYVYFAENNGEFSHLHKIVGITESDFEFHKPLFVAEKDSYYTPGVSAEEIAEAMADIASNQCGEETGWTLPMRPL